MGQSFKYTEPTIWALRKKAKEQSDDASLPANDLNLYTHLFGYDPIRIAADTLGAKSHDAEIRRGSAENPTLNIINPTTNFMIKELASEDPSKA
ncbi:MAG: hypothetical protein DI626_05510 [Micavibrio aeruginosavorus]|uniref:Uncharacterized protein n=1 Tax=Micavibrio aeruginosavorus TaxID=349221 RepID=A0A2W4ZWZ0_9BACT|nr:MAG: hypothetical protein DI626_05510 [Micavibrio aeruginosavorus]